MKNKKNVIASLIVLLIFAAVFAVYSTRYKNITGGTADYTLVEITSASCNYCKKLKPEVEHLKANYSDRINFHRIYATSSKGREYNKDYKLLGVPTLLFFDKSGELVDRIDGYADRNKIENIFKRHGFI